MNLRVILSTIIFCGICSCGNETKRENIHIDLSEYQYIIDLKEVTDYAKLIKLETTSESFIGGINNIIQDDSLFMILDKKTKSILVFHSSGKFIRKIHRWGKGMGEYIAIQDMDVNKESKIIYVYDDHSRRMIAYDYKGQFLSDLYLPDFLIRHFAVSKNGNYLAFKPDISSKGKDGIWAFDKDGNLIKDYTDIDRKHKLSWIPYPYISRKEDTISFLNYYDDYIYAIEDNKLEKKLKLQIKQKLPDKYVSVPDGIGGNFMGKYYMPAGLNETTHYYHFNNISFESKPRTIHVFIEKKSNKKILADSVIYDTVEYLNIEKIFSNDAKNFIGVLESATYDNPALLVFNLKSIH